MDGSDPKFNTVLMRSPNVFGIFSVQISRFLAEIYDFEQFSWAPVQDFSKNTLLLERYLCIFSIFHIFCVDSNNFRFKKMHAGNTLELYKYCCFMLFFSRSNRAFETVNCFKLQNGLKFIFQIAI